MNITLVNTLKKGRISVTAIAFFMFFVGSCVVTAQNTALFEQGKQHYKSQNYQEAITNWKKIIESGKHSSDLYFNLGNAYYKLNKIGPAVYYYEKALQLNPSDKDIKTNLKFAQNARIDVIEPLPETLFHKWYKSISGILTYNGWALASVVFVLLFALLFLLYYFTLSEGKKRLFFVTSLVSLVFFALSITMAFLTFSEEKNNHPAIVFAEATQVKNEPNMGAETTFTLHEGTKVQILETDDSWVLIQLENGKQGWMPKTDLKAL